MERIEVTELITKVGYGEVSILHAVNVICEALGKASGDALTIGENEQQKKLLISYEEWKEVGDVKNLFPEQMAEWFLEEINGD